MYNVSFNGKLFAFQNQIVMGIVNATPDSFYKFEGLDDNLLLKTVETHLSNGTTIIDIGGCSTRPDTEYASQDEEYERVKHALKVIRRQFPDIILSIDTFRSEVAQMAVQRFGVAMVNDISGGQLDNNMFFTVGQMGIPYILTHYNVTQSPKEGNEFIAEVINYFQERIYKLKQYGVKDIILDPGLGFGKSIQQNYMLLKRLGELKIFRLPILVGVSHKSMIYKTLDITASDTRCDFGTTTLETAALQNGADIIRTHNSRIASDTIKLLTQL